MDNPSTPVEDIGLSKMFIVKGNGTENPTIDFDFWMMGKQYLIIDDTGRVIKTGKITDSTMGFWDFDTGVYFFGIQWIPIWTSQKIIVK